MTVIKQQDLTDSVADALQFISYYHPLDFVQAVHRAWEMERNPAAKDAMAQILINSRMCAMGHRPICQDTGIVTVFIEIGMSVQWEAEMSLDDIAEAGFLLVATSSHRGTPYRSFNWSQKIAVVMGNEAHGVDEGGKISEWVQIPQRGRSESLNVAMAGTLIAFALAESVAGGGETLAR